MQVRLTAIVCLLAATQGFAGELNVSRVVASVINQSQPSQQIACQLRTGNSGSNVIAKVSTIEDGGVGHLYGDGYTLYAKIHKIASKPKGEVFVSCSTIDGPKVSDTIQLKDQWHLLYWYNNKLNFIRKS